MTISTTRTAGRRHGRAARSARIGLEVFAGTGALAGGIGLVADNVLAMPADWLARTPFDSWTLPGVFLLLVVAAPMLVAATAELRRSPRAVVASSTAGVLLVGWIVVQWLVIGRFHWLQPTMLLVGLAVVVLAWPRRAAVT
jgi:hypothetical protein